MKHVLGFVAILAPQLVSISKLSFAIVDVKVNWPVADAVEEDRIIASKLEVGAEIAS